MDTSGAALPGPGSSGGVNVRRDRPGPAKSVTSGDTNSDSHRIRHRERPLAGVYLVDFFVLRERLYDAGMPVMLSPGFAWQGSADRCAGLNMRR